MDLALNDATSWILNDAFLFTHQYIARLIEVLMIQSCITALYRAEIQLYCVNRLTCCVDRLTLYCVGRFFATLILGFD